MNHNQQGAIEMIQSLRHRLHTGRYSSDSTFEGENYMLDTIRAEVKRFKKVKLESLQYPDYEYCGNDTCIDSDCRECFLATETKYNCGKECNNEKIENWMHEVEIIYNTEDICPTGIARSNYWHRRMLTA